MKNLVALLRRADRAATSVGKAPLPSDDATVQHALESMRAADRWMAAVMTDADRVFKRGRRAT